MVGFVLAVEVGLAAFLVEGPVLFNTELVADAVLHDLKDLEELVKVLEDGLGEADGVEQGLAADDDNVLEKFLGERMGTSSASSTSAFSSR